MTTSAPSAFIFFTVSGVAATRGSAGSTSAGIATFIRPPRRDQLRPDHRPRGKIAGSNEEVSHQNEENHKETDDPLRQRDEEAIHPLVFRIVIAVSGRVFDLAVVGHVVLQILKNRSGWGLA